MAMRCSPNGGVDSKTVVNKVGELRTNFWVLYVLRTVVLKHGVLDGKYRLEYDDFVVCQC